MFVKTFDQNNQQKWSVTYRKADNNARQQTIEMNIFGIYVRRAHMRSVPFNKTPHLKITDKDHLVRYKGLENSNQSDKSVARAAEVKQANNMAGMKHIVNIRDVK